MTEKTSSSTIRDVARQAGVSVATVSRVINGSAAIAPETEARVRAVIAELHFIPLATAQNLSNRRTNVIGFVSSVIGWDNFFPPMFRGVEAVCFSNDFDLLMHSTHHDAASPRSAWRQAGEHNTDGLIVFTDALADERIRELRAAGFPLVLLHRTPPAGCAVPHVVFENQDGARRIVDHLIEVHGFRRIGFLEGQKGNEDGRLRERGYRESLEAHGIGPDPSIVGYGGFDVGTARGTVAEWIGRGMDVEALFAADDDSAYGAIQALQAAGVRVPEDVAVAGFDDSPTSSLFTPPLTTVAAPIEEAGRRAAAMLVELIRTGSTEPRVVLPTHVVIRASCGCAGARPGAGGAA
jgi:LacI family transcriptional regulator